LAPPQVGSAASGDELGGGGLAGVVAVGLGGVLGVLGACPLQLGSQGCHAGVGVGSGGLGGSGVAVGRLRAGSRLLGDVRGVRLGLVPLDERGRELVPQPGRLGAQPSHLFLGSTGAFGFRPGGGSDAAEDDVLVESGDTFPDGGRQAAEIASQRSASVRARSGKNRERSRPCRDQTTPS